MRSACRRVRYTAALMPLIVDAYNATNATGALPPDLAGLDLDELCDLIDRSRYRHMPIVLVADGAEPGPIPSPDVTIVPFDRLNAPTRRTGVFPSHVALFREGTMAARDNRPGPIAQPRGRIVRADISALRLWTLDLTTGGVCEFERFTNDDTVEWMNPIAASSHDPAWVFALPRVKTAWGRAFEFDSRRIVIFDGATGFQCGSLSLHEALAESPAKGRKIRRPSSPPQVESIATTLRGDAVVVEISHPDDSPRATVLNRRRTLVVFDTSPVVNASQNEVHESSRTESIDPGSTPHPDT
ncbi:MAG: hypothetical protein ACF8PN_05130 [Phycisphaerales bacterium]